MRYIGQNIVTKDIRFDLEIIARLIKENSKVLDIGCGNGELLKFLKENKKIDGRGLEISQRQVSKAIMKGLSVIQGDAESDLEFYPDDSFDYAILSQTIQATKQPKAILEEMLRIAKFAIVSLPNFAYFKNRLHLVLKGTMPINKSIPFEWYETPNIHFCSIKDFKSLCKCLNLETEQEVFLSSRRELKKIFGSKFCANLMAEYGIFVLQKNGICAASNAQRVEVERALPNPV